MNNNLTTIPVQYSSSPAVSVETPDRHNSHRALSRLLEPSPLTLRRVIHAPVSTAEDYPVGRE